MKPDLVAAERFLSALASDGDFVFQTFDDDDARKDDDLAITTRSTSRLASLQAKRAGVFVTINVVKGTRRLAANITKIRALFADFDEVGTLRTEWAVYPSIIVESSPGKFHCYWLIDGDFPVAEFKPAQRALARAVGSDPKIIDPSRVMRVPGYWHQKGEPFQTRIVEITGQFYSYSELREWLKFEPEKAPERTKFEQTAIGSDNPYLKAGVAKSLDAIATAKEGTRNHTLNSEAFGMFGFVKGGHLDETEARSLLTGAALAAGLVPGEIDATLNSAWTAARARDLPAPRGRVPARYEADAETMTEAEPEYASDGSMIDVREEVDTDAPADEAPKRSPGRAADMHFQCLGYNRGHYYYLPKGTGQIVTLKASEHTPLRMLELANLSYWFTLNGGEKPSKDKWMEFANSIMRQCEQNGIFDECRMRGRGAWIDGARVIVNTGGEAHIGKEAMPLEKVASRYVYEAGMPWDFGFARSADSKAAHRLVEICERLTWDDPLSGALMAGWSVIAPVSGALKWRPHIWITGPSGSGKSTALDIIGRVVGPSAERVDGKVTEAGIRQLMGFDARPVVFDESEGEDQAGALRMQQILELARSASSGARIPKGGANGVAKVYIMRSAFCFSSINTSVRQRADESRISRLVLKPNTRPDADKHYLDLVRDINSWLNAEFAGAMFTRTVENLPTLLKNIEVFTAAAASLWRDRRAADQIGPMLAGYYLCHSTGEISLEKATEFIRKHQWGDFVAINTETDEMRLLQFIISRPIRVQLHTGPYETTIGSAIEEDRSEPSSHNPYRQALGMRGIKVDGDMVAISDSAENTREMFRNMPMWASDWKRPLRSLPGAMPGKNPERFSGGIISRVTWIPYGHFDGTYREREPGED